MAKLIAETALNASTIKILNTIRANASPAYQAAVPVVTKATDIPKLGAVVYGTPAFSNEFLGALINRVAAVRVQSATFNNPYKALKKGYLEYGETIEDIFVAIVNVVEYSAEKAEAREFKRSIPDVRSAFHVMNWRTMYPVTIQDVDLQRAFLSLSGVTDLVAKIVDQIYTAAEYDEFLLFKYLLIKAISHGKMKPVSIGSGTDLKDGAVAYRSTSNVLPFMSDEYNEAGVLTNTPKERQVIFMDANYNAQFDVNVLASAFNMDKAEFMGKLYLIDNWTSFDNKRFAVIREHSDGIEEVTSAELALMADVKAVIMDENWFQIYDNQNKFTEKYVASGLYWNYFYHTWKTVSYSPFANAVVFVPSANVPTAPASLTIKITGKDTIAEATVFTLELDDSTAALTDSNAEFVQTQAITEDGIAIQKYGAVIIPASKLTEEITLVANLGGATYTATTAITGASDVGDTVTMNKNA